MSERLELIVGTTTYNLSDDVNYTHLRSDGFGMAPTRRLQERGPLQHGVSDLGFRLEPRKIPLVLLIAEASEESYWGRRDELLRMFKPSDTPVRLRYSYAGKTRQLDCYFSGELTFGGNGRSQWTHVVPIELYAPDPTWYDPTGVSVAFSLGAGGDSMDVPLAIPWKVGVSVLDAVRSVAYGGSWLAYPTVIIKGPVTDPVITNLTTGDKLDFTGTAIGAGDQYVIDCRYGYKTVTRQSDGANRIADLTSDSALSTFSVEADPVAPGGVNDFRVTGSGVSTATEVYLQFNTRYVGI